ncbi:MAG: DNA-directed RNA polymerase RPB1, partial [Solumvirus sp.]
KGIPGITHLLPVSETIISIIRKEVLLDDTQWYLQLNDARSSLSGITRKELTVLLSKVNITVNSEDKYGLYVTNQEKIKPSKLIEKVLKDEAKIIESESKKESGGIVSPRATSQLQVTPYSQVNYARCMGRNYMSVMLRGDVDTTLTTSNNIHDIARTLGVEAAYNLICQELQEIIKNVGSYVNPRHVKLVTDSMCGGGYPTGNNYQGYIKKNPGTFANAVLERASMTLVNGARVGKIEGMNISSSIALGSLIPVGTGSVGITINQELLDKYEAEMKRRSTTRSVLVSDEQVQGMKDGVNAAIDQQSAAAVMDDSLDAPKTAYVFAGSNQYTNESVMEAPAGPLSGPLTSKASILSREPIRNGISHMVKDDVKNPVSGVSVPLTAAISNGAQVSLNSGGQPIKMFITKAIDPLSEFAKFK